MFFPLIGHKIFEMAFVLSLKSSYSLGFLRRPQNLKKSSSYFWKKRHVLCEQQRTCQKFNEDFSKQMWSSHSVQTLCDELNLETYLFGLGSKIDIHSVIGWSFIHSSKSDIPSHIFPYIFIKINRNFSPSFS